MTRNEMITELKHIRPSTLGIIDMSGWSDNEVENIHYEETMMRAIHPGSYTPAGVRMDDGQPKPSYAVSSEYELEMMRAIYPAFPWKLVT